MFPPFSLISRVLQKIEQEKVQGIIIVPKRPTQTWWPVLIRMLIDNPVLLPKRKNLLFLPSSPDSPSVSKTGAADVPLVWRSIESQGISTEA